MTGVFSTAFSGCSVGLALGGCAGALWPADHDLQSLQSLAKGGIWDRLMDAIIAAHDGKVQMIDSTICARSHQQAAAPKNRLETLVSVEVVED
jgi:hypothetical protein